MSYNKKAIADALSKMNKARKPKQVNDIIMDPEGQNKFPGLPTRIPSNNITMETTPYPVLGVDNFGNQQMMYPGANYTFPGADYVDEYPMMQKGGQRPIYVTPVQPNPTSEVPPLNVAPIDTPAPTITTNIYKPTPVGTGDFITYLELQQNYPNIHEKVKNNWHKDPNRIPFDEYVEMKLWNTPASTESNRQAYTGDKTWEEINQLCPECLLTKGKHYERDENGNIYFVQNTAKFPLDFWEKLYDDDNYNIDDFISIDTGSTPQIVSPQGSQQPSTTSQQTTPAPQQPSETPKSSEPKIRYHREWNPYTNRYEPMSPKQRMELDRLHSRDKPMPENWQPILLDERTRQPVKKQTGGATDWKSRIASTLNYQKGGLVHETYLKAKQAQQRDPKKFAEETRKLQMQKFREDMTAANMPKSMVEAEAMIQSGQLKIETIAQQQAREKREADARKADRIARLEAYEKRVNTPGYNAWTGLPGESWRDMLAAEAAPLAATFRFSQGDNFIDDYINPAVWIGSMAQNLGEAPKQAKETGSLLPYITSIGTPLLGGAMAGIGATNTGQFVNNMVNPFAGMNPLKSKQLPGSPNAISSVDDVGKSFKSEIDWGKWNKEIPENKALMQEYNAIEQQSKANGTWMKNPDGSPFQGTPEQFVQQNSENFKKAFPDYYGKLLYHGSPNKFDNFDEFKFGTGNDDGFYGKGIYTSPDRYVAKSYSYKNMFDPNSKQGEIYELYVNSKNPGFVYKNNERVMPSGTAKDFARGINNDIDKFNYDLLDVKKPGNHHEVVIPFNNTVKSAIGNNGMFDMTNPNIYKSILPFVGYTGAAGAAVSQFQEGGTTEEELTPAQLAMMKARLAYAHMHGNPSAQRMVAPVDNPYIFTGTEPYASPDTAGYSGTHYMFSQGPFAVPTIQTSPDGQLYYNVNASPNDSEAMQFDSPEDAEVFARYYKTVAPAFQDMELTDEEIEEYKRGGCAIVKL